MRNRGRLDLLAAERLREAMSGEPPWTWPQLIVVLGISHWLAGLLGFWIAKW